MQKNHLKSYVGQQFKINYFFKHLALKYIFKIGIKLQNDLFITKKISL